MARRSRIVGFGSAAALVVAGALAAAIISGTVGQVAALVLIGLGLVLATGLVFLEVGMSEDKERAREAGQEIVAEEPSPPIEAPKHQSHPSRARPGRPRLGRMRGSRRRLS
jgi:hypothetical protein